MKNMDIPTWLYLPAKALLLIGFLIPFILWAKQIEGLSLEAESAILSSVLTDVKSVEQKAVALISHDTHSTSSDSSQNKSDSTADAKEEAVVGVDVSHFQGKIDWTLVAKSGVSFAFAKATEGNTFIDPYFSKNWKGIHEAKLYRGAYHFFLADEDPKKQAVHFVETVGELKSLDFPPMLDVETADHTDVKTLQERVFSWLQEVESRTGRLPIIYTDNGFADTVLTDSRFEKYPLWIADYAEKITHLPSPWDQNGWQFWQYEESGIIAGIEGKVDKDRFKGSQADLIAFINKSHNK